MGRRVAAASPIVVDQSRLSKRRLTDARLAELRGLLDAEIREAKTAAAIGEGLGRFGLALAEAAAGP